jgi:hypothetical protein
METNPIVTFVVPDSIGAPDEDFPIGWTAAEGRRQLRIGTDQNENYSIIFLNDELAVPPIQFANKHPDEALLVITHFGSGRNSASGVPDNPKLQSWGKPIVCASYRRREKGYPAGDAIELLISERMSAADFAEKWRNQHDLDMYENLMVLLQIKILNPKYVGPDGREGWTEKYNKIVPGGLRNEVRKLGYEQMVKELRERASLLSK